MYIYIYISPSKIVAQFLNLFLVRQQRYSIKIWPSFISHLEEEGVLFKEKECVKSH